MKKPKTSPQEPTTEEGTNFSFETFREVGTYEQRNLTSKEPSCFNGNVNIIKYKITVERVEEPNEVLAERLQKLWDESDNSHHSAPLMAAAKKLGYELKGSRGNALRK